MKLGYRLVVPLLCLTASSLSAAVKLASPFGNHMVLQQGQTVPVWGTAAPGEKITVAFSGRKKNTTADNNGRWRVDLAALKVSASPRDFVVTGSATPAPLVLSDVLVGEVWLCGGQSNMERQLGPRPGQPPISNWEAEVAAANHPLIRQLYVKQSRAITPQGEVDATWTVCSPETVTDFTAVGYFFARDLHAARGVPVGILHSSWGGTPAEAWTSREAVAAFPEFGGALEALELMATRPADAARIQAGKLARWYADNDPGSSSQPWHAPDLDTSGWETMTVPTLWEDAGHPGFDGVVWFRKTFDLPDAWAGRDLDLRLGAIDDADTTWVNGVEIGATSGWNLSRVYRIPTSVLQPGNNTIAIRVLDTGGGGGLWDPKLPLSVAPADGTAAPASLAGPWLARFATPLGNNRPPMDISLSPSVPTVLFNGMIAPLVPYAMRGVIFYQGEANADRPTQYRTLFPALIADWRQRWGQGNFPFLFVQIAPFKGQPPEIREAQFVAWQHAPNTALAVTIDCGDANDIHPANKEPVGARLALAARALAYGEKQEYSGPAYAKLEIAGNRVVLHFTHVSAGLVAPGGKLEGFTVAGSNGIFHTARAEIVGDTVVVTAEAVSQPVAVRYAWANVPQGNLFNRAGLPASPFRTDIP